ncbi:hypothetical protein [Streptomyces sp. NPDC058045]|uniref:hypothetical protein n=1 Tax=Streptomyces sp. NPDC058045 TaxID=3346311 RepID=UPI0036EC688C
MTASVPSGAQVSDIEVTAATVQRGDIIQLGGGTYRVRDLRQLPQGGKQLVFATGELLTMHARTRLLAMRIRSSW